MRVAAIVSSLFMVLALSGAVFAGEPADQGKSLLLAENGKALMPIVISEEAMKTTEKYKWGYVTPVTGIRQVADDLAEHLERITGARFEVTTGNGTRGIVLGTLEDFPALKKRDDIVKALEIRDHFDGVEALAIRTEPERLLLVGGTILGASHAASRLLQELGCRWFFPAEEWRIAPSIPTLRVNMNLDDRPKILSFQGCYGYGPFLDDDPVTQAETVGKCNDDYLAWLRHNLVGESIPLLNGHAWGEIIAKYREAFDQHPEYFALRLTTDEKTGTVVKRERNVKGDDLCVSNPEAVELCKRYALDYFAQHPDEQMVSMTPGDYAGSSPLGGHCQCDQCAAIGNGSVSDQAFYLANEVAKAVAEKYPGKLVGMLAYEYTADVPSFPLEPNVYVELTNIFTRGQHSYDQLVELWPKKTRNIGFYDYYSVFHWDRGTLAGTPQIRVSAIRKQIPRLAALGAKSFHPQIENCWGPYGLGFYTVVQLRWNPAEDVDALLKDFYDKAFGPAAGPMKRYYERFNSSNVLMSGHLIGLALRDLKEATRLAAGHPDVLARLDDLKIYQHYFRLVWTLDRTTDKDQKKELLRQIFTHAYRSRYAYMMDWAEIRYWWAPQAADQYGEPTWQRWAKNESWRGAAPYTRQEVDALSQDDLAYFEPQIQDVEEKTFSTDLVPIQFAKSEPGVQGNYGGYQGGVRYALYSIKGEPLVVTITTGTIWYYRDRGPAYYRFVDPKDNKIAEGNLPQDGEKHKLTIDVPSPGLYYLDFDDSSVGWGIEADADRPLTVPLSGRHFHQGGKEWYFYVPKGTRKFQYYHNQGGYPHLVIGPDGNIIKVEEDSKITTIPVPQGMDGKLWRFSQFQLRDLWFYNIPNYVAGSPNALLVPREVAERDSLAIRGKKR